MYFEIIGNISGIQVIALNLSIRERSRLVEQYGRGRWRKLKGTCFVRVAGGNIRHAEVHWYEAHGVGKRKFKIKRFLD